MIYNESTDLQHYVNFKDDDTIMNKPKLLVQSALYLIVCELAAFVIVMFFPLCYQNFGSWMSIVFGICSTGACICLYGDFAWKSGKKAGVKDARLEGVDNSYFGLIMGIIPTAINYVYVILVYLSKFRVVSYDFYPLYKTLTFYFMPWTYLFAPNSVVEGVSVTMAAVDLSWYGLLIITILPLVFLITCYVAFYIGYKNYDMKAKIVYGK